MVKEEKIQIIVEAFTRGFKEVEKGINQAKQNMLQMQLSEKGLNQVSKELGITQEELAANLRAQGLQAQKAGRSMSRMAKVGAIAKPIMTGMANAVSGLAKGAFKMIKSLKGFAPEWLSILFISMGLNKLFKSMIDPILELLGVFDVWKILLIDLLVPVLLPLLDVFLSLLDFFLNLPEPVKKAIGAFIVGGFVLTKFGGAISQLMLLITSLGIGLGTIALILSPFVIALIASAGAVKLFGDDLDNVVDNLVNFIGKLADKAVELIQRFGKFFSENKAKILEVGNKIMGALLDGMISVLNALDPVVREFLDVLADFFDKNKDKIETIVGKIIDFMAEFFIKFAPDIINLGVIVLTKLLEGLHAALTDENVRESIEKLIDVMAKIIEELSPELGRLLLVGILSGLKGIGGAIGDLIEEKTGAPFKAIAVGGAVGGVAGAPGGPIGVGLGALFGGVVGGLGSLFRKEPPQNIPGRAVGGTIGSRGLFTLHPGEQVIPKSKGGDSVILNVTNNITVADRRDFERMLRENNNKLAQDVRRLTKG